MATDIRDIGKITIYKGERDMIVQLQITSGTLNITLTNNQASELVEKLSKWLALAGTRP